MESREMDLAGEARNQLMPEIPVSVKDIAKPMDGEFGSSNGVDEKGDAQEGVSAKEIIDNVNASSPQPQGDENQEENVHYPVLEETAAASPQHDVNLVSEYERGGTPGDGSAVEEPHRHVNNTMEQTEPVDMERTNDSAACGVGGEEDVTEPETANMDSSLTAEDAFDNTKHNLAEDTESGMGDFSEQTKSPADVTADQDDSGKSASPPEPDEPFNSGLDAAEDETSAQGKQDVSSPNDNTAEEEENEMSAVDASEDMSAKGIGESQESNEPIEQEEADGTAIDPQSEVIKLEDVEEDKDADDIDEEKLLGDAEEFDGGQDQDLEDKSDDILQEIEKEESENESFPDEPADEENAEALVNLDDGKEPEVSMVEPVSCNSEGGVESRGDLEETVEKDDGCEEQSNISEDSTKADEKYDVADIEETSVATDQTQPDEQSNNTEKLVQSENMSDVEESASPSAGQDKEQMSEELDSEAMESEESVPVLKRDTPSSEKASDNDTEMIDDDREEKETTGIIESGDMDMDDNENGNKEVGGAADLEEVMETATGKDSDGSKRADVFEDGIEEVKEPEETDSATDKDIKSVDSEKQEGEVDKESTSEKGEENKKEAIEDKREQIEKDDSSDKGDKIQTETSPESKADEQSATTENETEKQLAVTDTPEADDKQTSDAEQEKGAITDETDEQDKIQKDIEGAERSSEELKDQQTSGKDGEKECDVPMETSQDGEKGEAVKEDEAEQAPGAAEADASKSMETNDDDDGDEEVKILEEPKEIVNLVDDDDEEEEAPKEMNLQISSVSGGAEAAASLAKQESEEKKNLASLQNSVKKEVTPLKQEAVSGSGYATRSGSSPAKPAPAKTQKCIVCGKVGKCKYNIVRNGDIKHLCDDTCFKKFRGNPTKFLRASSPSSVPAENDTRPPPSTPPAAPVVQRERYKTCTVCQLMNINTSKPFLNWQGLDFCGEECLGKFQSGLNASCSYCASQVPQSIKAKHCFNLGTDMKQFCSAGCLTEFKKRLKMCAFCNKDLSTIGDSFMAPVGGQGMFKDFCSQVCLQKYEDKNNQDVEIIGFEKGQKSKTVPKGNLMCSVCHKVGPIKHEIKLEGKPNWMCSEPCLSAFQYANKLTMNTCDNCGVFCYNEGMTPQYIQFEGNQKRFCSYMCVNTFRTLNKKVVSCAWCGAKKGNFDMIERVDANNKYQLFCSLNCLSLYRVNLQATSNQAVTCDQCRKFVPAQYHLTMSDASVRNFCSYNCVMGFQSQFSAPSTTKQTQQQSATPKPTTRMQTRGAGVSQQSPQNQQSSFPIISNVVSLAPPQAKGNKVSPQTVNLKSTTQVPVTLVSQAPSQTVKTTAQVSSQQTVVQQQIIIQPPPPKQVKNKSLLCKPFVQTKATSCRPHTQTKETQTEAEAEIKQVFVPFPVPVYVPTPMAMYTTPTPYIVPIPIPIPVPCFIPTTRKSASGILKTIKEILEKIPSDPLEAELLMMAEAVAGDKTISDSESDNDGLEPETTKSVTDVKLSEDRKSRSATPQTTANGEIGEDMLQMALRMASEMTSEPMDMETQLEPVPVNTEPPPPPVQEEPDNDEADDDYIPVRETRSRSGGRGTKRSGSRGGRRSKRARVDRTVEKISRETSPPAEPATPPQPPAPPPDAHLHLKYTYGVNAWKHWVIQKNTTLERVSKQGGKLKLFKTDLLQCSADELNYSLCLFVKEVRKPNGEEYATDSIFYLCLGIQMYLFESGRIDNIFTDMYYEKFTECLNEVLSRYEPKLNAAGQLVCRIEEEHLWESKQLGAHSPHVLLNTLVYFNTKYFMLKTADDHMKLSFTHIMKHWKKGLTGKPGSTPGRSVYLRYYCPGSVKTPDAQRKKREELPVYEQCENLDNPLRCPVKLYEFYLSKCPESIKNRNDTFYLVPERSCVPDSPVWYSTQSMGPEQMNKMLNRLRLIRGIGIDHGAE